MSVRLTDLYSLPTGRGSNINIIERCAGNYFQLGMRLLNDYDGSRIDMIKVTHNRRPVPIMKEIFRVWIASGDHSWRVLIESLSRCDMHSLARDVTDTLRHNNVPI